MSKVRCVGCGFKMYLLCCSDVRLDQQALCQECYARQAPTQATCDHCNQSLAPQNHPPPPPLHRSQSQGHSLFFPHQQQGQDRQPQWQPINSPPHAPFSQTVKQPLMGQNYGGSGGVFGRGGWRGEDDYDEEKVNYALTRIYEAPLSLEAALKKERRKNGLPLDGPVHEDNESICSWSTLKADH